MGNPFIEDALLGVNNARAPFCLSGGEWADAGTGPPIVVGPVAPGVNIDGWGETYGASYDSFLTIADGSSVKLSIDGGLGGVYQAYPQTSTDNLWEAAGGIQQVHYLVSGDTIEDARDKTETFGEVDEARGLCMRLPMMACGYGKTTEMLPLIGTARINPQAIKTDRNFWNTGSVDLRWDSKRRTWAAFNDLIADHEGVGIGTPVFSTNPDSSDGFPYLKGRLEDVWWVRQTTDTEGTSGKTQGATSAEVMTHLKHKWFDEEEEGSASLDTIFIIPHKNAEEPGKDKVCHEKGDESTLGSETTGDGKSIDIRSEAHFYQDVTADGPIAFGRKASELGSLLACDAVGAKLFHGEMVFLDEVVDRCGDDPGEAGQEKPCEWVPAVRIDECCLVGGHFGKFYANDAVLAGQNVGLCVAIHGWSSELINVMTANDGALAEAIKCVHEQLIGAVTVLGESIIAAQLVVISLIVAESANTLATLINLVTAINAVLGPCCEAAIGLQVSNTTGAIGVPNVPEIEDCPILTDTPDPFPCENCKNVKLEAPCAENEAEGPFDVPGGDPCSGSTTGSKEPDYEAEGIGECASEEGQSGFKPAVGTRPMTGGDSTGAVG